MTQTFNAACIQNCARLDMNHNIGETSGMVRAAHKEGAHLVCLPEYFAYLDDDDQRMLANAFAEDKHPALSHYQSLARELNILILLGSLAIKLSVDKFNNRSYLINANGETVARYDKLHLFDVDLKQGESYRESATVSAGSEAVLASTPWGVLGLSVCYDLRFPQLYRTLARGGAGFLSIPAAFTRTTGKAHWHVLQRARAIETGSYVFAPCQGGDHESGWKTYGHSLIVDPWGKVLADGGEQPGYVIAEIDPRKVQEARRMIPSLQHDREFSVREGARHNSQIG